MSEVSSMSRGGVSHLLVLPEELVFYIFSFLSLRDLSSTACVSFLCQKIVDNCRFILSGNAQGNNWIEQYQFVMHTRKKKHDENEDEVVKLFNAGKQRKAISKLVSKGIVKESPDQIAKFIGKPSFSVRLDPKALGSYLTRKQNQEILDQFLATLNFAGMDLVDALRLLISRVELPSAQKIGSMMEKFAKQYSTQNPEGIFNKPMVLSNLSYGIFLICHTELNAPRVLPMPMKKFIANARGINGGNDFPTSVLLSIYQKTVHTKLKMIEGEEFPTKKCGWLSKQGMDLLKMWKKRWFLLAGSTLYYFKKPGDPRLGLIILDNIVIRKVKGKKGTFKLSSFNGSGMKTEKSAMNQRVSCFLASDNDEDCDSWVQAILASASQGSSLGDSNLKSVKSTGKDDKKKQGLDQKRLSPAKEDEYEAAPYFGVPLAEICEREGTAIPQLVELAVDELIERALEEEGILRLSGSLAEMNIMREQIELGKPIDFSKKDCHAIAGILKSFLRELPEPIISKQLNEGIAAVLSFGEGQEVLNELRTILFTLPQQNFDLFKHVVGFLMHVSAHSEKNKMHTNNLLRVMTPTMNCSPGAISLAMENYDFFFENVAADEYAEEPIDDPSLYGPGEISSEPTEPVEAFVLPPVQDGQESDEEEDEEAEDSPRDNSPNSQLLSVPKEGKKEDSSKEINGDHSPKRDKREKKEKKEKKAKKEGSFLRNRKNNDSFLKEKKKKSTELPL